MRKFLRWFLGTTAVLIVAAFTLIGPVDNSPLATKEFYHATMHRLDTFRPTVHLSKTTLRTSWAKVNITPMHSMPMAGYAPRDRFDSVHDSIYVRILIIDNGGIRCAIISADLLIFPPALKNKILEKNKNQFVYFTATHTHSSLGAWDDSVIGNLILGSYNDAWLDSLAHKIHLAIEHAVEYLKPSSISYFEADANEYVENRLDPQHGKVDGMIRGLQIIRNDGAKALMISYSAHPTNIDHLSRELSGDYPSSLVRQAERRDFNFAMFASSTIGSHRAKWIPESEFAACDTLAIRLYKKLSSAKITPIKDSTISTSIIPIDFGPSQLHLFQNYKVRDWAFRLLFRKLNGDVRYLKIGNIILLGMPCDFSGEILVRDGLDKIAENQHEKLLITSFNGDYVGYITYDDHYGHSEQEEVMAMNWVGPHYGTYYSQIVKKIIERSK